MKKILKDVLSSELWDGISGIIAIIGLVLIVIGVPSVIAVNVVINTSTPTPQVGDLNQTAPTSSITVTVEYLPTSTPSEANIVTSTLVFTPIIPVTLTPESELTEEMALTLALQGIGGSDEWEVFSRTRGDIEWVLVPRDRNCLDDSTTCIANAFWIGRYEITNAQFSNVFSPRNSNWTGESQPRERVNWYEAYRFCEQKGGKLPTVGEWEYAAGGIDNLNYPWGNDFVEENAVYAGNSQQTNEVGFGHRDAGISWVGAYDMSGNVSEWTSSGENNGYIVKGGSWSGRPQDLLIVATSWLGPNYEDKTLGFRCTIPLN